MDGDKSVAGSVLKILVAAVGCSGGVMAMAASNPRNDYLILIWVVIIAGMAASIGAISAWDGRKRDSYVTQRQYADVLMGLKVLIRSTLVSEHDRLVTLGNANDTQRRNWITLYEVYEGICSQTHDHNGVIDKYKQDILSLPPWVGE
jgi:hypothetical protein